MLVAVAALPGRAWWAAAPAIALCATIPFFNDQANLDAHAGNVIPAVGVAIAGGLTVAATLRAGSSLAPRRPWDRARVVVAALLVLVSLPWISAELGFHFPGDVFMGEEVGREGDEAIAAVHLGHHHGLDGAMLVLTWTRALPRRRPQGACCESPCSATSGSCSRTVPSTASRTAGTSSCTSGDGRKRRIPSALLPSLTPIWLVVIALAVVATLALRREERRASYSAT